MTSSTEERIFEHVHGLLHKHYTEWEKALYAETEYKEAAIAYVRSLDTDTLKDATEGLVERGQQDLADLGGYRFFGLVRSEEAKDPDKYVRLMSRYVDLERMGRPAKPGEKAYCRVGEAYERGGEDEALKVLGSLDPEAARELVLHGDAARILFVVHDEDVKESAQLKLLRDYHKRMIELLDSVDPESEYADLTTMPERYLAVLQWYADLEAEDTKERRD
jgi:hypothetical protein